MTKRDFIAQYVLARVPTKAEQKYVTRSIVKEAVDYWEWIVIACTEESTK